MYLNGVEEQWKREIKVKEQGWGKTKSGWNSRKGSKYLGFLFLFSEVPLVASVLFAELGIYGLQQLSIWACFYSFPYLQAEHTLVEGWLIPIFRCEAEAQGPSWVSTFLEEKD